MKEPGSIRVLQAVAGNASLRRALAGYLCFATAEFGVWVAILFYGYKVGGAKGAAVAALVQLIPATIFAPVGSALVDQMRPDRALALGFIAQATTMLLTAGAMVADAPVWVVYSCASLAACAVTLTRPVFGTLVLALSRTAGELTAANAVTSWVEGMGVFAGPMLAGVLIASSGPGMVFAVLGAAMLVAALLVLTGATPDERVTESTASDSGAGLVGDLVAGFREARSEPGAILLLCLVGGQFAITGMLDVLVIGLALDSLNTDASGPGVLIAGFGVGGLLGAAMAVVLFGRKRLGGAFLLGALLNGVPLLLMSLPFGYIASIAFLAASGAGKSFAEVTARTLMQRSIRSDVLGRVLGLQEGLAMASLAIGSVLAPILVAGFGVRGAFAAAGLLLPLAAVASSRMLSKLDDRSVVPERELALLSAVSIFKPLSGILLERLAARCHASTACDEAIIREGEEGDKFYVIDEGKVAVSVAGKQVAVLGHGDFFGEIALLRDVPRMATCSAVGPVKLLSMSRLEFRAAVLGTSGSAEVTEAEMGRRLRQAAD